MRNAMIKNFQEEKFSRNQRKRKIGKFHECNHARDSFDFSKIFNIQPNKQSTRKGYFQFSIYSACVIPSMQKSLNRIYVWNKHNYHD